MDAVPNNGNRASFGLGDFHIAHTKKVPFIDAPLLGGGERSERFFQLLAVLLLLLQVFGHCGVEQVPFVFRGQGVI